MSLLELGLYQEPTKDGWQKMPELLRAPNGYELAARAILGKDDRWEVYAWEVVGPDCVKVTGGVVSRVTKSGRRQWSGKGDVVVVSDATRDKALRAWEESTGSCSTCGGSGREYTGWSRDLGYRYRTCTRCDGNGKRKEVAA